MSDLTISQIIDLAVGAPASVVALETSLNGALTPLAHDIGATKDPALNKRANYLLSQLTPIYTDLNSFAQSVSDIAGKVKPFLPFLVGVGSATVPYSGVLVDEFNKIVAEGEKLAQDAQGPLSDLLPVLGQVVTAAQAVITAVPALGAYKVGGVTVATIIADFQLLITELKTQV